MVTEMVYELYSNSYSKRNRFNMKKFIATAFLFISASRACTGFAVFSDKTWFGMNFDYPPESEIRFSISETPGKVFYLSFQDTETLNWNPTAGMNEHGLFSSLQYQCPMVQGDLHRSQNEMYIHELFITSLESCSSLSEVKEMLGPNRLINLFDLPLHCLTADIDGHSFIAEAGEEANELTGTDNNWIVMTNFKVSDFRNTGVEEIEGVGSERYRNALEYIESNFSGFGYTEALATLEAARNTDAVWGTKASMVFDPTLNMVYICLSGDFSRVWKLSMQSNTIETNSGFQTFRSADLSSGSITATDLSEWR